MVDLTTFETGRRFLLLLAKGGLARLKKHELPPTPEGFRKLVQIAKASGRNGAYLLDPVQDELNDFHTSAPLKDIDQIFSAFETGDSCQRGTVWLIMQALLKEKEEPLIPISQ